MIKDVVKQPLSSIKEDYDIFWESIVSKAVENIYKDPKFFVNAYSSNSHKVFVKLCNYLKVVPIDIKESLQAFYRALNTFESDDTPRTA
jgi:hypothetical protein